LLRKRYKIFFFQILIFLLDKFYEAEETFLQAFKIRTTVKTFATFLRLGHTFLYRKAWGDARAVLTKACELKPNSSLGWLGLGNILFLYRDF